MDEALAVASWASVPPVDLYDLSGDDAAALLTTRDDRGDGYYPLLAGADVVERLSRGLATAVLPEVFRFARERFGATRLRAAVAAFNARSLRLCASAGFRPVREFACPGGRPFVELVLDTGPLSDAVSRSSPHATRPRPAGAGRGLVVGATTR